MENRIKQENGHNILALVKGDERYIFTYADENRAKVIRTLSRFASDKDLSFSWYDAAILSQRIRGQIPSEED